ncbi:phosphocholine cytidylyltransferase family protein [Desulfocurvus sp. DL9XJH121]
MKRAVILAAGRGSRMKNLTLDKPKCLVEILGRPLLHWQLEALQAAGASDISVVTGYLGHSLEGDFKTFSNPRWSSTNMVSTLLCAHEVLAAGPCIVAYSDILYRPGHVRALARAEHDLAVTYDTLWEPLWSLRFADPLEDAETFEAENGLLTEIGGRPSSLDEIRGQFMGLLRFTPRSWGAVREVLLDLPLQRQDSLDTTALLRLLLAAGLDVGAVPVAGGWVEVDSARDLALYEERMNQAREQGGAWSHDWREASA